MIGNKSYWGQGIGSETIRLLGKFAFEEMGLRKLTAGTMGTNLAMIRVFQKMGFILEGTIRQQDKLETQYVDHILLGCFKDEFKNF
jgi:RimJ/RimL family protein N-acetyltransferase